MIGTLQQNAVPDRNNALTVLQAFLPKAGENYAQLRNFDRGAGLDSCTVSTLSPFIRRRILTEEEVLRATLGLHSPRAAGKFIQEVFWRSYWKGWLELRPTVWRDYRQEVDRQLNRIQSEGGLRQMWQDACAGDTGIACFDAWARELAQTGYLHNHARMWFASIWVFTLGLPWALGADFFLRHLRDGDPASNTLSWRWVAGLHTQGKHYVASAQNIAKFTEGRFFPSGQLAQDPAPLPWQASPAPRVLPPTLSVQTGLRTGLLVHDEDVALDQALNACPEPVAVGRMNSAANLSPLIVAPMVTNWAEGAITHALAAYPQLASATALMPDIIAEWAKSKGLEQIVTPYAPTGPVAEAFAAALPTLEAAGIRLCQIRRTYDSRAWPFATHGFFRFKDQIPALLAALDGSDHSAA
ncbi:deoxyribodipyrimidine photo-lyase [Donghicola tyrosinivorans]|uniref:Deoxyribodipyrimidine photo-lyase n=1 Tax=Donghicola tyrosinivorans TaxID=1652492 RepID=A0A2T0WJC8_9RHOB|nr:deoxyribodipyrimidine photo-lyase [Donghicola tyrosinivorans]